MADHTAPYTYHWPLSDDGLWVWPDFDAEIGFSADESGEIKITSVSLQASRRLAHDPSRWARVAKPIDLLSASDPTVRALGERIRDAAYADGGWIADALHEAGWEYRGRGGNDPDGRMVRVA